MTLDCLFLKYYQTLRSIYPSLLEIVYQSQSTGSKTCQLVNCFLKFKFQYNRLKAQRFKYKIIHKILGTDKLLYLATIKDSSLRSICNMYADSLEHLFNYGQCVKTMGTDRKWNKLKTSKDVNLDLICLVRYTLQESASLNLIILCTKRYIYIPTI